MLKKNNPKRSKREYFKNKFSHMSDYPTAYLAVFVTLLLLITAIRYNMGFSEIIIGCTGFAGSIAIFATLWKG